jgi:hypothetical protein
MHPLILNAGTVSGVSGGVFGELDGVYDTTGHGVGAESVVTYNSKNYIIFPNVWRTSVMDMAAICLE